MARKTGERGTDYYAPSGSRYWEYAGNAEKSSSYVSPYQKRMNDMHQEDEEARAEYFAKQRRAKQRQEDEEAKDAYFARQRQMKSASDNARSISNAGTVRKPSDSRESATGAPRSGDSYQRQALENAFGKKTASGSTKREQDTRRALGQAFSERKNGSVKISSSKQNKGEQRTTITKEKMGNGPTGNIVKREEPKYNQAKEDAQRRAREAAMSARRGR